MEIAFKRAGPDHRDLIFGWLSEPHIMEFWDNTPEHKEDILNFIHGRKQHYFYGTFHYWIGYTQGEPFSIIITDIIEPDQDLQEAFRKNLPSEGHAICLDFGIGNKKFLGRGLAAPTLDAFVGFYRDSVDALANTFFIDPDPNNPRAVHVYEKAGFVHGGDYTGSQGAFKGSVSLLMVRRL